MGVTLFRCTQVYLALLVAANSASLQADEVERLVAIVAQAGPQGAGSAAARLASSQLANQGVASLPSLLRAMDTTNIVAANWYRTAFETIIAREAEKAKPEFPVAVFQAYTRDAKRQGRPRRMVLNLLDSLTPDFRESVLPTMLEDPEFRPDAVAAVLKQGDQARAAGDTDAARAKFQNAFEHARDVEQLTACADRLKSIGVDVNIVDHLGFVTRWYLLGPFHAPERSGFDKSYPPQQSVDLEASYTGKDGAKIAWQPYRTEDRLGQVNLIQAIAQVREAVGYAYAELDCPRNQDVQLRCGADDNLTVWLNGEKILARRQWLNGTRLDRFTAPASLKQGKNKVLVKICQGPQHKNPAVPNNWSMQLRFCEPTGRAADFESTLPGKAD